MRAANRVLRGWRKADRIVSVPNCFQPNGPGRKFASSDAYMDLWLEIFQDFGLEPVVLEPQFKNFMGVHFLDGAHTPIHVDRTPRGFVHARCNVLLEKPAYGGDAVIDNQVIPLEKGDAWLVFASEEPHGSTPISGGQRVIFSFGALLRS